MTLLSFTLWMAFQGQLPEAAASEAKVETCTLRGTFTIEDEGKRVTPEAAVVYVSTSVARFRREASELEIVQKNKAFTPSLLVMQKGDTLRIVNAESGAVRHEAHVNYDANAFAFAGSLKLETARHTFNDVGESYLRCTKHEEMKATILTVPNRFHTTVAADGSWSLAVPTGVIQVSFWSLGANHHNITRLFVHSCERPVDLTASLGKPLPLEPGRYP